MARKNREERLEYCREYYKKHTERYRYGPEGRVTPELAAWNSMRARCNRPQATGYKHYGARGIKICERWNSFAVFLEDMGPKPEPKKKYSLDRIDVNGNYEPANCRWADREVQANNRRTKRIEQFSDDVIRAEFVKRNLQISAN